MNDPVKDIAGETVDNDSQDVQNYNKEYKNWSRQIKCLKFEEQKDKENKDMEVNELTDMMSQLELDNEIKPLV